MVSYQEKILVNARLVAIIRAMKDAGTMLEDTLRIQTKLFRQDFKGIPCFAGRVFVHSIGRFVLNRLAKHHAGGLG